MAIYSGFSLKKWWFSIAMLNYQKLKHIKTWKKSCHQTWLAGEFFIDWLVVWNMNGLFFHILGMSSFQLTNSYFSEGVGWNHQPDWYSMIFPTSFWEFFRQKWWDRSGSLILEIQESTGLHHLQNGRGGRTWASTPEERWEVGDGAFEEMGGWQIGGTRWVSFCNCFLFNVSIIVMY